jgi:putative membrane protein
MRIHVNLASRQPSPSMKKHPLSRFLLLGLSFTPSALRAAEVNSSASWHAQSLGQAVAYMLIFALVGIFVAIAGYKVFDKCTPGDLTREILEHRNVAAAIIAAAVILGLCIIVAAAMLG